MFPHRTSKERLQNVKLSPFLGYPRSLAFLGPVRVFILHQFLVPWQRLKRSCVVPGGVFTRALTTLTAISGVFLYVLAGVQLQSQTSRHQHLLTDSWQHVLRIFRTRRFHTCATLVGLESNKNNQRWFHFFDQFLTKNLA